MSLGPKVRKVVLTATDIAGGVLVCVLFMWTPATFNGLLVCVGLFAVMVSDGDNRNSNASPTKDIGRAPARLGPPGSGIKNEESLKSVRPGWQGRG